MTADTTPLEFIRAHVARVAAVTATEIESTSRLIDFGLDSLKAMDLVIELEQAFDIEVSDRDLIDLTTIQEVADYVDRRRQGK